MKNLLILVLAGLCFGSAAHAQQLYRCGNAYQKEPCTDGKGKAVRTEGNTSKAVQVPAPRSNYSPRTSTAKVDCDMLSQNADQMGKSATTGSQTYADTRARMEENRCGRPPAGNTAN